MEFDRSLLDKEGALTEEEIKFIESKGYTIKTD